VTCARSPVACRVAGRCTVRAMVEVPGLARFDRPVAAGAEDLPGSPRQGRSPVLPLPLVVATVLPTVPGCSGVCRTVRAGTQLTARKAPAFEAEGHVRVRRRASVMSGNDCSALTAR